MNAIRWFKRKQLFDRRRQARQGAMPAAYLRGMVASERLLAPQTIAVIGTNAAPESPVAVLVANLLDNGFGGAILPVVKGSRAVHGVFACDSIAALPAAPDLALIDLPADQVADAIGELGAMGTSSVVVVSQADTDGTEAIRAAARTAGIRLIGPGSSGLALPHVDMNASFSPMPMRSGRIAVISRGDAVPAALLDWAEGEALGFSAIVSLGAAADLDYAETIEVFAADPRTRAILLHIDSPVDARRFISAARSACKVKPIVVYKPGRHADAARLGLAGSGDDAAFAAAMRRAGVVQVDSFDELRAAAVVLARPRPLRGERLAILANGAVPAAMALDALEARGGQLAGLETPTRALLTDKIAARVGVGAVVDLGAGATPAKYREALTALLADHEVDAVLTIHAPTPQMIAAATAQAVMQIAVDAEKQVIAGWLGGASQAEGRHLLQEAGVPSFATPELAIAAFMHLVAQRRLRELMLATATLPPGLSPANDGPDRSAAHRAIDAALSAGRDQLDPAEAEMLLAAYGIDCGALPDALHAASLHVDAIVDPVFGPVLRVGRHGGYLAAELPTFDLAHAIDLIERAGLDREPGVDVSRLAFVLSRLSDLLADLPEVVAMTIDPLEVSADRISVARSRFHVVPGMAGGDRLAIRPYPTELVSTYRLKDGRAVTLRPIRAEDEAAHQGFLERLSSDDLRMRFFGPVGHLDRDAVARFTHIDYDREMAFIATLRDEHGREETLGVARAIDLRDGETAEFALIIRSDLKRLGLGSALMTKLIDYCRQHGRKRLSGDVLAENTGMRKLMKHLGFVPHPMPEAYAVTFELDLVQ